MFSFPSSYFNCHLPMFIPFFPLSGFKSSIIKSFQRPNATFHLNNSYFSGGTVKTLLECLEPNHLLQVFFQLLLEENVLFISSSSLNLTATAEAFCSLLYPFKWMSPYIPLLPRLIGEELFADFELDCPVPFIIGKLWHCFIVFYKWLEVIHGIFSSSWGVLPYFKYRISQSEC